MSSVFIFLAVMLGSHQVQMCQCHKRLEKEVRDFTQGPRVIVGPEVETEQSISD